MIAVAKKPGRPKGSANKITKEIIAKTPAKRGRKPGSKNKPKLSIVENLIVPVEVVEADTVDFIAVSGAIPANDAEIVAVSANDELEAVPSAEPVAPDEVIAIADDVAAKAYERVTDGFGAVIDIKSALSTAKANKKDPTINHEAAEHFLNLLDEGEDQFTFQTFDDNKDRKDPSLTRIFNGTYAEHAPAFVELNKRGAGIFVVVNKTDLTGRKDENIILARTVFIEDDSGNAPIPLGLEPHITVKTSGKKKHHYFLTNANYSDLEEWKLVQERLVLEHGCDPNAKDLSRVLRLPGFYHRKDPNNPQLVEIIHESGEQVYSWEKIKQHIPPLAPKETQRPTAPGNGENLPDLRSALEFIDPDCEYLKWLSVGMAISHDTNGGNDGFTLWDDWSKGDLSSDHVGATYNAITPNYMLYKWNSFTCGGNKSGAITRASIFKMAQDNGWHNPKKKQSSSNAEPPPHHEKPGDGQSAGESENKQKRDIFKRVSIADIFTNPPIKQQAIWGEYIPPKNLALLAAHGGTGKTTLANQLGIHVAIGRDFLGIPVKQSKTLIFSAEDATDQIRISIAKICKADGIDPVEVAENLIILDATDTPVLYEEAMLGGVKKAVPTDDYYELERFIKREKIEFLIVDNASDTFGANPIDRMAVTSYIRALVKLVRDAGGAVLLLSHVNKNTSTAAKKQTNTESYADSAAWHNSARSRMFLNAIDDNGGLVLSHQKNNLGPKHSDLHLRFREDGSGMEALNAGHVVELEINKSALLALNREPVLKLIHEFYGREEWINPSTKSPSNAHGMLKAETDFPFGRSKADKDDCLAMIRDCDRDGLIVKEVYRKLDRHDGERWKLTEKGMNLIKPDSEKS